MYLRHVFLNLRSIAFPRIQNVNKSFYRPLSSHKHKNEFEVSTVKKSPDKGDDDDDIDLKSIIETKAARKEREKADWDRLSFIEKFVKKFFPSQINSIAILIVAGIGYVICEQIKNDYEIKHTFRNGSCPNFKFKEEQLLERKSLLDTLTSIVTPVADKLVSSYYIVLGEHGVGKSTLIRQAARNVGRGVIYVDVPSNVDKFGFAFARAIRFNFKEHIRLSTWIESKMFGSPPDDGKEASWERVILTFEKYAIDFKKRYGSVPILIFDNCDSLANKDPKMLEILQDTAKTAIDDSTWVTVFVTSVGNAPEQMEGRSSITRASSFIEVSDLSKDETMTYLIEKRNLSKEMANNLYGLFGGRIKSLQNAASKLESGVPFTSIRKSILQDTARRIEKIRCRGTTQEQTFLFNVLCGLLYRPELTVDELIEMEEDVSIRQSVLDELRNETLLIRSVSTGSYIYHSQVIKVCVEEYYKNKCLSCNALKV
ncbi:unnamed protein product [Adineta steineri]|uniref:AAA+ ATPase domain-containing protein n=2 Tax=Adineta steineri TaxID=433720 RepID=A0A818M0C7_9BILA|nr:unnamed protein product [Adineta steineri]CAF0874629.1 unnamed protein product [Adineta steineri]CAF0938102.1 unnamed protein product [Adineta steineri]CAF3573182.1 unnamed protein product [Adineta steineri]CAF3588620.1 unnamed protein product [Adineta steineri]